MTFCKLVDIDRREALYTNTHRAPLEIFVGKSLEQLVELIRNPKWIPFRSSTNHLQAFKSRSTRSSLLGLPQEVIDMVVCNLSRESRESVIYLSLTCVYFFRLLGPAIQTIMKEDAAPWAGHRLIFVSNYAHGLDTGGICTIEELSQFDENNEKYYQSPLYYMNEDRIMCARNQHIKPRRGPDSRVPRDLRRAGALEHRVKGKPFGDELQLLDRLTAIMKRALEHRVTVKLSRDDLQLFDRLTAIMRREKVCSEQEKNVPVLRILTARKYVRDDVVAESDYAYSLGEIVAVLTVWTHEDVYIYDSPVPTGLPYGNGPWAGHRFDIATMEDVSEEGWTDISRPAVERLRHAVYFEGKKSDGKRA